MSRRKRYTRNLGRPLPSPKPVRITVEWIRFEHEQEPFGVFSYSNAARAALAATVCAELDELLGWFSDHLQAPDLLSVERFWFRAEASTHVMKARRLAAILGSAGIPIVERRTKRIPGKVRWEDQNQVAVLTYRDTPQSRRGR
jgi:hypothetical protein